MSLLQPACISATLPALAGTTVRAVTRGAAITADRIEHVDTQLSPPLTTDGKYFSPWHSFVNETANIELSLGLDVNFPLDSSPGADFQPFHNCATPLNHPRPRQSHVSDSGRNQCSCFTLALRGHEY
ncbi:hypothetical protein F5Y03DRAFT_400848 [Xylaria venustula]|nr:hypothetical protein F5Y03DRAFT_400848 [Xylaria venustula]